MKDVKFNNQIKIFKKFDLPANDGDPRIQSNNE
jgi:hypothetical protein